ncbi:hypothetical protein ACFCW2_09005 [Qipengyuania sp. DSG2-2]|uniref:hypothetical protein n=1 Tax=Qipengyuania sp. DGS2-2 TaxID=3349631 RepID=UPI0036D3E4CC
MQKQTSIKRLLTIPALALALAGGVAAPAQAQIPALLPYIGTVEPLEPMAIDGIWRIREIDKLIVIDRGHGYAVEGWVHALIWRVMPRHIVLDDLRELGDGRIAGRDLPLMAAVTMVPIDDYTIRVTAHGLIPVTYHLELVEPGSGLQPGSSEEAFDPADSGNGDWYSSDDTPGDTGAAPNDSDESWFPAEPDS